MKIGRDDRINWSLLLVLLSFAGLIVLPFTSDMLKVHAVSTSVNATNSTSAKSDDTIQSEGSTGKQIAKNTTGVTPSVSNATKNLVGTGAKGGKHQSTSSEQAAQSIRGAIISTGQFLKNVTNKVAGSRSAQTILNETSEALGNASTAAKRMFSGTN